MTDPPLVTGMPLVSSALPSCPEEDINEEFIWMLQCSNDSFFKTLQEDNFVISKREPNNMFYLRKRRQVFDHRFKSAEYVYIGASKYILGDMYESNTRIIREVVAVTNSGLHLASIYFDKDMHSYFADNDNEQCLPIKYYEM